MVLPAVHAASEGTAAAQAMARLVIHAPTHADVTPGGARLLARLADALRCWWRGHEAAPPGQPSSVTVEDRHGRAFFALEHARPPIELPLPPGTYHVTLRWGAPQRRYTVTLEEDTRVDLVARL